MGIINWLLNKIIPYSKNRADTHEFKANLRVQKHDPRDFLLTTQPYQYPIKSSISKLPPIRNQQNIGSCASHAVIGLYETLLLNFKPNQFIEGSELYHYYNARKYVAKTFPNDSGMTLRDACKTLDKYHMALEYACPYNTTKFNTRPSNSSYLTSRLHKIKSYESIGSLNEIKGTIAEGIPVMCGIDVYDSFMSMQEGQFYVPSGRFIGGHAQEIVAYDDEDATFTIRNSWGNWGSRFGDLNEKGYYKIKQDVFMKISLKYGYWIISI